MMLNSRNGVRSPWDVKEYPERLVKERSCIELARHEQRRRRRGDLPSASNLSKVFESFAWILAAVVAASIWSAISGNPRRFPVFSADIRPVPSERSGTVGKVAGSGRDADQDLHPYMNSEPGRLDALRVMFPQYDHYALLFGALNRLSAVQKSERGIARAWRTLGELAPDLLPLLKRFESEGHWSQVRSDLSAAKKFVDVWHLPPSLTLRVKYIQAASAETLVTRWRDQIARMAKSQELAAAAQVGEITGEEDGAVALQQLPSARLLDTDENDLLEQSGDAMPPPH